MPRTSRTDPNAKPGDHNYEPKKYDYHDFLDLDRTELENRVKATADRILMRMTNAADESRDLSNEEHDLCVEDRNSLLAHEQALDAKPLTAREQGLVQNGYDVSSVDPNHLERARGFDGSNERRKAEVEARNKQIYGALHNRSADRGTGDLEVHFRVAEERALAGEGHRFTLGQFAEHLELYQRSTTTSNAGAAHAVGAGASGGGIWLPRESGGVNLELRPGTRLESGIWPANTAAAATAEGATKPTLDPSSLGTDTVSPYAVTSNVTIQSEASGRGVEQFTWAGTRKVRRSVNDAFTTAMIAAGGTARTFDTDVVISVDSAISDMMATAATVPTLVIVDPAHFSALANAGGDDATDAFPSFRGVRLVSSAVAGLAGHALIIDGSAITYSMSGIEVRTQPQVISNSTDVVVEVWFAAVAYGASGVTLQDLAA